MFINPVWRECTQLKSEFLFEIFRASTSTNKKQFANFRTQLFTPKSTKTQLPPRDTIQELITNNNYLSLLKISSSLLLGPHAFISNLKFTNPTTQAVQLFQHAVALLNLSRAIEKVMTPIVKSLPSYIKDSNHALEIFHSFNFSGENKIIFTMDITSLYTVIPNNEGLQALKYFFNQRPIKRPSAETLLRLAELFSHSTVFLLVTTTTKQINGVAMGTKMEPSYANLFVGFIENKFFSNYHGPKPDPYKRYIDDCVGATSSSREELNLFIKSVNSFHPALK